MMDHCRNTLGKEWITGCCLHLDAILRPENRRRESPFCEQAIAKMIKDCCEGKSAHHQSALVRSHSSFIVFACQECSSCTRTVLFIGT